MEKASALVREGMDKLLDAAEGASWLGSPLLFWRRSIRQPLQTCSLFPSRPSVGRSLYQAIAAHRGKPVIELGAGTGAVTRQLLLGGIAPADLTVVELDPEFTRYLSRHFPGVEVLTMGAETVAAHWRGHDRAPVGAVVSTLPLKLFDADLQRAIIGSLLELMEPGAPFMQLTYRLSSPVHPEVQRSLGLKGRRAKVVLRSIPPAFLWEYVRG